MSDLISRQAAIDVAIEELDSGTFFDIPSKLEGLPSAQPEIIRCKDCKYSEPWYRDKRRCFLWVEDGTVVFDDGFCNYADWAIKAFDADSEGV